MGAIKPISKESVPRALDKAERYRLLNEPFFAESICLDVLAIVPEDERALITYVLSITDQFASGPADGPRRAQDAIAKMSSEYDRAYYSGIVAERRAVALLQRNASGTREAVWHFLRTAMGLYEKAEKLRHDAGNDDAVLRYNTCIRLIQAHRITEPAVDRSEPPLE